MPFGILARGTREVSTRRYELGYDTPLARRKKFVFNGIASSLGLGGVLRSFLFF
jgi:hypothetical protein